MSEKRKSANDYLLTLNYEHAFDVGDIILHFPEKKYRNFCHDKNKILCKNEHMNDVLLKTKGRKNL